jgi:hypothetical protein
VWTGTTGVDTIPGGSGKDIIKGSGGADILSGGDEVDQFVYTAASEMASGESVTGGANVGGRDKLVLKGANQTYDMKTNLTTLSGIEEIDTSPATGTLAITVNDTQVSGITHLTAGAGTETITIDIAGVTSGTKTVNLSTLTLTDMTAGTDKFVLNVAAISGGAGYTITTSALGDQVTLIDGANSVTGLNGNNTITGGSGVDQITGGAGVDQITGGASDDVIIIGATGDDGTGESYTGGAHTSGDTLRIAGTSTVNLSNDTITTIEILDLQKDATGATSTLVQTVTMMAAQKNSFMTVNADATDLLTFTTLTGLSVAGTAAVDTFKIANSDSGVAITSFILGTGKDVIDVSAFVGATRDAVNGAATSTIGVDGTAGDVALATGGTADANVAVLYNAAGTIADANVVGTATVTNGEIVMANNQKAVIFVGTAGTATTYNVYQVTAGATAGTSDTVTLIGTVASNALSSFDISNVFTG